jgi:CheY-like chemotaxis protein
MSKGKILTVDDEEFNLDILGEYLTDAGYEVISAEDGQQALDQLEANPDIDVIVLDRMMPRLDGMACLSKLKSDDRFRSIPVIMQTAAASHEHIRQGIEAGVFYYLTKPYEDSLLISLVGSALEQVRSQVNLQSAVRQNKDILGLLEQARFKFRTLEEARQLSVYIANAFPDPETVVYGLSELMINAIEHGNLGITYSEKTKLVLSGQWHDEVNRRLSDPQFKDRYAILDVNAKDNLIEARIIDMGEGFDHKAYLELSPERATDPHGRGIATTRMLSFDDLQYQGRGNEVVVRTRFATN